MEFAGIIIALKGKDVCGFISHDKIFLFMQIWKLQQVIYIPENGDFFI